MSALQHQASAPLLNTLDMAARRLSVSRATFYRLVSAGELQVIKLGSRTMVAETELERFVARLQANSGPGAASG